MSDYYHSDPTISSTAVAAARIGYAALVESREMSLGMVISWLFNAVFHGDLTLL